MTTHPHDPAHQVSDGDKASYSVAEIGSVIDNARDLNQALMPLNVGERLVSLQDRIAKASGEFQALLVTNTHNLTALTGFRGSSGRLLVMPDCAFFLTDGRYAERAEQELSEANCPCSIAVFHTLGSQDTWIDSALRENGISLLALEADDVSWATMSVYKEKFEAELVATSGLVEELRRCKSIPEIQRIARAAAIADQAFSEIWQRLAQGVTEAEFAAILEGRMRDLGAQDISFASVIASGPNGSRPHHDPGGRSVASGDLVICDFGAKFDGYHSDTTRTVSVGTPTPQQRFHLDVVLESQRNGASRLKVGESGSEIDRACRDVLAKHGWEQFLTTGTGHGTGLQIHEQPWIGSSSESIIAVGDTATVEPGAYLPRQCGVRIEDLFLVCSDGVVAFNSLPYDLVTG